MKRKTKILLLLSSVAFALFLVFSDAVAQDRFTQVSKGMTEAQVRELLGGPDHVRHDAHDTTRFFYGGFQRWKWCTMEVFFDKDGRVIGQFHDH